MSFIDKIKEYFDLRKSVTLAESGIDSLPDDLLNDDSEEDTEE